MALNNKISIWYWKGRPLVFLMFFLVFLAGCMQSRLHYRPGGSDPYVRAEDAGSYQQLELDGVTIGNVKIWSQGVFRHSADTGMVMHIGMRVMNDSQEELILDLGNTQLLAHFDEGQSVALKNIAEMVGSDRIPAGIRARIELLYSLSNELGSRDVKIFELDWVIKKGERRLSISTPFYRDPNRRHVYFASAYMWGYYPWSPYWAASYPLWIYPAWPLWYRHYFSPWNAWWWHYPTYRHYPNYRYLDRHHHSTPKRPVHHNTPHRHIPRRKK